MTSRNVGNTYLPWIDGMRALILFFVILYYGNIFPFLRGVLSGADLFFVLSGYVAGLSQSRNVMAGGREIRFLPFLSDFYKRRLMRLLPALAACLALTFLFFRLFSINDMNPFSHLPFLVVAGEFYLIFPVLFYLWLAGGKGPVPIRILSRIAVFLPLVLSLALAAMFREDFFWERYYMPVRLWEFYAGAVLFFIQNRWHFLSGGRNGGASLFLYPGFALILVGFFLDLPAMPSFAGLLFPVGGTLLVLWGMGAGDDHMAGIRVFLGTPFMIFWGKRVYSLFLWHWPVIAFMKGIGFYEGIFPKVISLLIIFTAALLSYRFIERPLRYTMVFTRKES